MDYAVSVIIGGIVALACTLVFGMLDVDLRANKFFRSCFVAEHSQYITTASCSALRPAKNYVGGKSRFVEITAGG